MTTDGGDRSFGAPRFDIVLRGYDRRQVDEHLSRLQRVLSRMRGDLETARGQANPPPPLPPGLRPRPTPRRRPDGSLGDQHDVVGTFTDRMQTILQAAEDEAAEIRAKARADAERLASSHVTTRVEEEKARATLTNLVRQRDAVLADLTRVRGQLEALLSGPTARIALPSQDAATAAAARRDAGAGHPLPGTPAAPTVGAGPGGPPGTAPGPAGPVPSRAVPAGPVPPRAVPAASVPGGAPTVLFPPREGGLRPLSGPPDVAAGAPSEAGSPGVTRAGAPAPPPAPSVPPGAGGHGAVAPSTRPAPDLGSGATLRSPDGPPPDDSRAEGPVEGTSTPDGAAPEITADPAVNSAADPDAPAGPATDTGATDTGATDSGATDSGTTDSGAGSGEQAGAEAPAGSPAASPEDTLKVGAVGHSPSRS